VKFIASNQVLFLLFSIFLLARFPLQAQDDMMKMLENEQKPSTEYVSATFKGTRIVNGPSIEQPGKKVLQFMILHRFGSINNGMYDFFGLDQARIRLGLDYGISDRLSVGLGRSSAYKMLDAYLKYKILRQSTGEKIMPISMSIYSDIGFNTLNDDPDLNQRQNIARFSYFTQLMLARKFSEILSFQLGLGFVHRNFIKNYSEENTVLFTSFLGRCKLTKRFAITGEYFVTLPGQIKSPYNPALSLGFEIETGGHVFQMHLSSSRDMADAVYVTETRGDWSKGDIFFGFNISRAFALGKKKDKTW
jgi:hypothetical protein